MVTSQPQKRPPNSNDQRTVLGLCVLLVVIVFLAFGRTCGYGFLGYDDDDYFSSNYHVKAGLTWNGVKWAFQTGYASNWHPVTWLSLMLDAQFFGTGPAGPHLTNVILHAANTVLLFLLLRRLTGALWCSAFVAAVFAIHPLRVESVAWLSERKDVLSGFFFMLTLEAYARYVEKSNVPDSRSKIFYGLSLLFFALGLMSKPMLVTLPFVLLLLDWWPLKRFEASTISRLVLEKLPFFFLSAASCLVTILAQRVAIKPVIILPLTHRLGNAMVSYVIYLTQMIWPENLAVYYPYHFDTPAWQTFGAGALLLFITFLAIFAARRFPYFRTGWLWYLGMLVPAIGLVQVGGQAHADRYTYLPQIGLYIAIVWAVRDLMVSWRYRRPMLVTLALFVISGLMICTWKQTSYWRNDVLLWEHAIACTSGNYTAHNNLGYALEAKGQTAEATEHFQKALEIFPGYAEVNINLGKILLDEGRLDEAGKYFQRAINIIPDSVEAHIDLGILFAAQGKTAEAFKHYERAIELAPDRAETYNDLAVLLASQGRFAEAAKRYQKALELKPDYANARNNFGILLAGQGQTAEAIEQFRKALEVAPDNANVHYNLANILTAQGRFDEAIEHYRRALEQMPDSIHAHYQLALLLQNRGEFAAAVAQFEKVLELDPKHITAQNDLAWLLATCPDNSVHNGEKAVELAQQAVQLSSGRSPEILDTLAAAYAAAGRFPEAVETANQALNLSATQNNKPLADAIQGQLKLYEANSPFWDTSQTNASR
jgi:tetratricopeptide (TPR) repeat protein